MINMISTVCVASGELSYYTDAQKIYHNGCIGMVSPKCEISGELPQ